MDERLQATLYVIAGLSRLFLKLPLEGTRPIAILLSRNGQV
jgi:hypothetical protein